MTKAVVRTDTSDCPETYFIPRQFKVAEIIKPVNSHASYNRRDYYKVVLVLKGRSRLVYGGRDFVINRPALAFTNPLVPYAWENVTSNLTGYYCLFSESFLREKGRTDILQDYPLFKVGADPVFFPDKEQTAYITSLFHRMQLEQDTSYPYKYDLLRSCVNLLIHEGMKMQPADAYSHHTNAAARITGQFLELLERQFPADSPQYVLQMRKAGDYASRLSVHVNHLNAAVREVTGKPTSTHINERIIQEARALLTYTSWSVAEIGYCLGFEYPSYFNSFFRKHCGVTPLVFRSRR
ncbi:helix-turn-helix domain-containing protein [Chitinophaga japonensis]|uniref:Helix-turn-helix protein n=1 Tax=Chitinophaga japonensis TaxID=104662 RepID=A0A562T5S0_CHIJA|nr:helix-turn-helix domain-containing protein [Chitinophaga japonensis]TWI88713.1 helix-turn-helix protein [Chitinophaga japonensis]